MTNEANALPTLHRCANAGIDPPSVVHKPKKNQARLRQQQIQVATQAFRKQGCSRSEAKRRARTLADRWAAAGGGAA